MVKSMLPGHAVEWDILRAFNGYCTIKDCEDEAKQEANENIGPASGAAFVSHDGKLERCHLLRSLISYKKK